MSIQQANFIVLYMKQDLSVISLPHPTFYPVEFHFGVYFQCLKVAFSFKYPKLLPGQNRHGTDRSTGRLSESIG